MGARLWITIAVAGAVALSALMFALPSTSRCFCCQPAVREAAIKARLRLVHEAQNSFQADGAVDQDADGVGEYGYLPELAGVACLPGVPSRCLVTPLLSQRYGATGEGWPRFNGYSLEVLLPDHQGGWQPWRPERGEEQRLRSVDEAEQGWRCVARPLFPQIGDRAFCIDQDGRLLECQADQAAAEPRAGAVWSLSD